MTDNNDELIHVNLTRRWKARLIVSLAMLAFAFIGVVLMSLHARTYWIYSRFMALAYAIMSIWLFWYLNRGEHKVTANSLWHQILHWVGLIIAIYLVSLFVSSGLIGSLQAGLVTLTLLALTVYLSGVYYNPTFMLIGLTLGIIAAAAALIEAYLAFLMIPIILIVAVVIYFITHRQKHREHKQASD
jgi:hypothetical protein